MLLTHSWEDQGVHTFPKGIFLKVNIIAQLEFEIVYYNPAVHRFNHYTTRTPLENFEFKPVKLCKKNDLLPDSAHVEGLVNTYIYIYIYVVG